MTGVRELTETPVASPAPDQVRVSIRGEGTQMDVSLPVDAPVALLLPEIVRLMQTREDRHPHPPADSATQEARHSFWVLHRKHGQTLRPDDTLRTAGATSGELLRLSAQRALTAPTLSDDVVDAAARLNKSAFAGWSAAAARAMAFAGIAAGAAIWVYFLVDRGFDPQHAPLVGLAAVTAALLVGVAALAHRSFGDRGIGAALSWAAIPVIAAICWALLSPYGDYGLAAGCGAMLVVVVAVHRIVGTGHWGHLAAAVAFTATGLALVAHALTAATLVIAAVVAAAGTLGCAAARRLTARLGRFDVPTVPVTRNRRAAFEDSTEPAGAADALPTATAVWARVRSATVTRSALYTGCGVTAMAAVAVLLAHQAPARWSGLALATVCAVALGSYARRPGSALERASLGIPAGGMLLVSCAQAQGGVPPMPVVAFAVVLVTAVAAAAIGSSSAGPARRLAAALPYLEYLACAAVIPLAFWAAGGFARLGLS